MQESSCNPCADGVFFSNLVLFSLIISLLKITYNFSSYISLAVSKMHVHVQSSQRGSFRKAGVFFKKDTVKVTSSPAFRKTCTCKEILCIYNTAIGLLSLLLISTTYLDDGCSTNSLLRTSRLDIS
jgi:hypothetical protein